VPAAAFAELGAAKRLVASIERQGYPVEIRRYEGSEQPWVVWILCGRRSGSFCP
jgi:hypothetical protein